MKILQVANWYIPNHGYQEYFLADAWQRMGHDVLNVAGTNIYPREGFSKMNISPDQSRVTPGLYEELGTKVQRLPSIELRNRILLSTQLEPLVLEYNPDLTVVHGITGINSFRLARLKHKSLKPFRLVCDEHLLLSNLQSGIIGTIFYKAFRQIATPMLENSVDAFVFLMVLIIG